MSTHRERLLGQARVDLTALPELCDQLDTQLTERPPADGYHHKIVGSPALIRLDVFHLTDPRRKDGWELEDPRHTKLTSWLGVAPLLESWVRVLWEEIPELLDLTEVATVRSETSVLLEHWSWVEGQQWGEELAKDVIAVTKAVRASLGIKPEYRPRCRYCRDTVNPVEADTHHLTTWEACAYGLCAGCGRTYPKGPALDALGQVQEPMPLAAISPIVGIPVATLHRWADEGHITPANSKQRGRVFDLAAVRAVANHMFGRKVG